MKAIPKELTLAAMQTFQQVYELRSFTAAAEQLQVNQSAVSYTIDKLRQCFEDPLFFRQAGRVVPTLRCETLYPQIVALLAQSAALIQTPSFEPKTATATITLACNYYERQTILPSLSKLLHEQAPELRLHVINALNQGKQLLLNNQADLLLGPVLPDDYDCYSQTLMSEAYVCLLDVQHAESINHQLDLSYYLACQHITINYGNQWRSPYLIELDRQQLSLTEIMQVPSPAGIGQLVTDTHRITTIPRRLAEAELNNPKLRQLPCPVAAPFTIYGVWTSRTNKDPMHQWLRQRLEDCIRLS